MFTNKQKPAYPRDPLDEPQQTVVARGTLLPRVDMREVTQNLKRKVSVHQTFKFTRGHLLTFMKSFPKY